MINFIKNLGIWGVLSGALIVFSIFINKLPIWDYLTQFFVFLRTIIRPVDFFWNFDETWKIFTLILQILIAYSVIQVIIVIRNNFNNK